MISEASVASCSSTVGVPHLILELVVDLLICAMIPLPLKALATEENSVTQSSGDDVIGRTLYSMTLVHRTWTFIARHGLWHRVILDADKLDPPLSVSHRSRIRELVLRSSGAQDQEYWGHFIEILQHALNLRSLYVDVEIEEQTDRGFIEFMEQLRTHEKLESLWLVGDLEGLYGDVLKSVSHLSMLRNLVLDSVSGVDEDLEGLDELVPPKGLDSFAVMDGLDWPYFNWLVRPREGYTITTLALSLSDPELSDDDPEVKSVFYDCLAGLKSLHLSTSTMPLDSERDVQNEGLSPLLSKTTKLQEFTLTVSSALQTPTLNIPSSVTVFRVHHEIALTRHSLNKDMLSAIWEDDKNIASILSDTQPGNSPLSEKRSLKKIVLSYVNGGLDLDKHVVEALKGLVYPKTHAFCMLAGISLEFETYASPYFGILAESEPFVG